MSRRIIVLDLALLILLGAGGLRLRRDWLAFDPAHQVSAIQPQAEQFPTLPAANAVPTAGAPDWTDIPTHNPFSFDRSDIAILAPPEPPKPVGPKPILFGTMTLGQGWIAMLASGQPNNRNSQPMRVGQSIDGWKILEIDDKSVVVEANSNRQTVTINDPTAQVQRDYGKTSAAGPPAPVVQNVSTPSAPARPTTIQSAVPSSTTPNSAGSTPCVREVQTPFGIVRQPCDDSRR